MNNNEGVYLNGAKFSNQKRLQQLAGAYPRHFKLQMTLWIPQ
jgi:hypothetical protein